MHAYTLYGNIIVLFINHADVHTHAHTQIHTVHLINSYGQQILVFKPGTYTPAERAHGF